jgi:mannose-1-phosphate guanylyltransferase
LAAFALHAPEVLAAAEQTFAQRQTNTNEIKFDEASFVRQPDISIDYAVMERADNVVLVPAKFGWSDVGTWPAVSNAHTADSNGNTFLGGVVSVDTVGTHVQVESHTHKIVATVGLSDLVIVDTPDALLVAHKGVAQKVNHIVEFLKSHQHETTHLPATVHRPWGTYASLKEEAGYKVKRITVMPGQSLSLQYHHQRAEHWVVVQGVANVQIGELEQVTGAGEYRYIPLGETHRLTNIGTDELVMIEVQCGTYLGEDDIVRLADTYGRV